MNISICITTLNEEDSVGKLLDSLLVQTKKPDQIIVVDGGSTDKTVEIIRHYQQKDSRIKLLVEKCSRARGRNLGVEIAKSEIILMTDAGCIADPDWVKNIVSPFENTNVDVVAGFYRMTALNAVGRAMSIFMGMQPECFDADFLPSTRSIAFKKQIWEKVGGFSEKIQGAAEDTVFNYKLIKAEAKFTRMKNAIVEWGMPKTIKDFQLKIYNYAKGDSKSRIWFFPGKGLASHNIKAILVLARYFFAFLFLAFSIYFHWSLAYWFICLFAYFFWAFKKAGVWGPVLQIVCDFAVIMGFLSGIVNL